MSLTDMTSERLSFFKSSKAVITLNRKLKHFLRRIDECIGFHLERLCYWGTGHSLFIQIFFSGILFHVNIDYLSFWLFTELSDWNITKQLRLFFWSTSLPHWNHWSYRDDWNDRRLRRQRHLLRWRDVTWRDVTWSILIFIHFLINVYMRCY